MTSYVPVVGFTEKGPEGITVRVYASVQPSSVAETCTRLSTETWSSFTVTVVGRVVVSGGSLARVLTVKSLLVESSPSEALTLNV